MDANGFGQIGRTQILHAGQSPGGLQNQRQEALDSSYHITPVISYVCACSEKGHVCQFALVFLITQGSSQLFAGSYGYASRSLKVPNTLTTRFDTASVTKLFTAVA